MSLKSFCRPLGYVRVIQQLTVNQRENETISNAVMVEFRKYDWFVRKLLIKYMKL